MCMYASTDGKNVTEQEPQTRLIFSFKCALQNVVYYPNHQRRKRPRGMQVLGNPATKNKTGSPAIPCLSSPANVRAVLDC